MKKKNIVRLIIVAAVVLFLKNVFFPYDIARPVKFPLLEGSYWVYRGKTKWLDPDTAKIAQKDITLRMEIVEVFRREALEAAVVRGHPLDIAWYEEGDSPGYYLILRQANKYYLAMGERVEQILARLKDGRDRLKDLVHADELFLESPLQLRKIIGPLARRKRADAAYVWLVENEKKVRLPFGAGDAGAQTQYCLTYQTIPDVTYMDFVSGVGITGYRYSHHGSVAEAEVELIEYFPGQI